MLKTSSCSFCELIKYCRLDICVIILSSGANCYKAGQFWCLISCLTWIDIGFTVWIKGLQVNDITKLFLILPSNLKKIAARLFSNKTRAVTALKEKNSSSVVVAFWSEPNFNNCLCKKVMLWSSACCCRL